MFVLYFLITLILLPFHLNSESPLPFNSPGGIRNEGNTCYLASALQLFAHGYHGRINSEDPVLLYLIPIVEELTAGEAFDDIAEAAAVMFDAEIMDAPLGQTGCALEVFEQLVGRLEEAAMVTRAKVTPFGDEKLVGSVDLLDPPPDEGAICRVIEDRMLILPVADGDGNCFRTLDISLYNLLNSTQEQVRFQRNGQVFEAEAGLQEGRLEENSLPRILPIGLRRQLFIGNSQVKLEHDIAVDDVWRIPVAYLSKENVAVAYQLMGFIRHWGNAGGGHYTAYLLRGDVWFCADDASVTPVHPDVARAQAKQALVLLFQRVE